MRSLISLWQGLELKQRLVVAGATLAVFLAVLGMAQMASRPGMALLYAGLDPAAAGEVMAGLDQRSIAYQIRGESIFVPEAQRDALRMELAAQGLPAGGVAGYELLDGLSGFGTTAQMFDTAYLRAKEGELARTIMAVPSIRSARVHIARAPETPFARERQPTASVTLSAVGGVSAAQARAVRHLVAAAVGGMRPEDVAVIDAETGLVTQDAAMAENSGDNRAAAIRGNVERLLIGHLGAGKAVVEVAVDLVTERETISERRFDPQQRVAISSETEEKNGTATEAGGAVTVASNLPDGDAGQGSAGESRSSESRERVNYEVSETQRELLRPPGSLRRLSVAVLVDGRVETAADGTVTTIPRSEAELAVLRELVASAVGLDEGRGDVLVVRSLVFEAASDAMAPVPAGVLAGLSGVDTMTLARLVLLAVVVLILGLFVLRPVLLAGRSAPAVAAAPPVLALPGAANAAPVSVLAGEIDDGPDILSMQLVSRRDDPPAPADPVARLRRLIEARQAESAEILRGWMEQAGDRS